MYEIHLDTIDSTNTYAKNHCASFPEDDITCITAEEQTAGRGRYQRKWVSPRGVNILATFYFRLKIDTTHLMSLAQVMAFSLASVLIREKLEPKIKWPNDILLNGKKLAGVLCETQFHKNYIDVFLGIGINVNLDFESTAQIDQPATSLYIETGKKWNKNDLLKKLKAQWITHLELFKTQGFTPFYNGFENLLAYKGETIRCFDGKNTWVGILHSLTNEGQLNLYLPDHTIHTLTSGDISR